MPKRRLSKEKVNEILRKLAEGVEARQLASDYNVSVASIYNYRTRLGRAGTPLPRAKRGRKPKAKQEGNDTATAATSDSFKKLPASVKMESYNFIINGVKVTISGKAKNVHIAADSMLVNF